MLDVLKFIEKKGGVSSNVDHLEKDEERLAKEYGMVGDIDPAKVVQEARRRVEASKESLLQLDRLHEHRLELAKYRRSIGNISVGVLHLEYLCAAY